ncbi:MAG: site-specific integrase [Actinomycetia bacterium]|nr:site-specific integrase [Actinomycetes bacterium]
MGRKAEALDLADLLAGYRQLRRERDRLLFGAMLLTGARIGEAIQLEQRDAYHDDGAPRQKLDLRPEICKGRHGGRVPIGPDLRELLIGYWPHLRRHDPHAPLFPSQKGGGPLTRSGAQRIIGGAFRRARVDGGTAHSLRKGFATLLLKRGAPANIVRELMRHKSLKTTDAYIAAAKDFELRTAVENLACPLFNLGS